MYILLRFVKKRATLYFYFGYLYVVFLFKEKGEGKVKFLANYLTAFFF